MASLNERNPHENHHRHDNINDEDPEYFDPGSLEDHEQTTQEAELHNYAAILQALSQSEPPSTSRDDEGPPDDQLVVTSRMESIKITRVY